MPGSPTGVQLKAAIEAQFPGYTCVAPSGWYALSASPDGVQWAWGVRQFFAFDLDTTNASLMPVSGIGVQPTVEAIFTDDEMKAEIRVNNRIGRSSSNQKCNDSVLFGRSCQTGAATTASAELEVGTDLEERQWTLSDTELWPWYPDDYTYPAGSLAQLPTLAAWKTLIGFPGASAPAPLPFRQPAPELVPAAVLEERRFACFGDRHDGGCGRAVKIDGRHYCGACGCKRTPERSLEVRLADPRYGCPIGEFQALTVAGRRVVG